MLKISIQKVSASCSVTTSAWGLIPFFGRLMNKIRVSSFQTQYRENKKFEASWLCFSLSLWITAQESHKNTLSFAHWPNWGGPPAKIDFDTFLNLRAPYDKAHRLSTRKIIYFLVCVTKGNGRQKCDWGKSLWSNVYFKIWVMLTVFEMGNRFQQISSVGLAASTPWNILWGKMLCFSCSCLSAGSN